MNDQLNKNLKAFRKLPDEIKTENAGRTALLHDGKIVDIYNDGEDAYRTGCKVYGLGNFSIETFGEKPVSLGYFTQFVTASGARA